MCSLENCEYKKICAILNRNDNNLICPKIIHESLRDLSWKERAIYKFTPYQTDYDRVKYSLQAINPIKKYEIGKKIEYSHSGYIKYYAPLTIMQKPLAFDLDVNINEVNCNSVLERKKNGIVLATVLSKEINWLSDSFSNCKESEDLGDNEEIVFFIASLFCSKGNASDSNDLNAKNISKFLRLQLSGYIKDEMDELDNGKKISKRIEDDFLKLFDKSIVLQKSLKKLNKSGKNLSKIMKRHPEKINDRFQENKILLTKLLRNIRWLTVIKKRSNFLFPLNAVKDYLYIKEDFSYSSVTKFSSLCEIYINEMLNKFNILKLGIDAICIVLNNKFFKKMSINEKQKNEILENLNKLSKQINVLKNFTENFFLLLCPIGINEERVLLKINFVAKNYYRNSVIDHPINLRAARSIHFQMTSKDIGYKIKIKGNNLEKKKSNIISDHDSYRMFGRLEPKGRIAHGNTRKKSYLKVFTNSKKSLLDSLNMKESIFKVRTKYKLSNSLRIYLTAFSLVSLFTFLYILLNMSVQFEDSQRFEVQLPFLKHLFLFIDKLLNQYLFVDINISGNPVVLMALIASLVGILVQMFIFNQWSIVHFLIRWHKRIIIFLSSASIVLICLSEFNLPVEYALLLIALVFIILLVFGLVKRIWYNLKALSAKG